MPQSSFNFQTDKPVQASGGSGPDYSRIIIFTDGGSRGNPGAAAIGGIIQIIDRQGRIKKEKKFSQFLGDNKTNNEAEYAALAQALRLARKVVGSKSAKKLPVQCFLDSELVVKQLNHQYKLKNEKLQGYFIDIWNAMLDYKKVDFQHVPREENKEADRLVNLALDARLKKG